MGATMRNAPSRSFRLWLVISAIWTAPLLYVGFTAEDGYVPEWRIDASQYEWEPDQLRRCQLLARRAELTGEWSIPPFVSSSEPEHDAVCQAAYDRHVASFAGRERSTFRRLAIIPPLVIFLIGFGIRWAIVSTRRDRPEAE